MRHLQAVPLVIFLALLGASCSSSVTITADPLGPEIERAALEVAPADIAPPAAATGSEPPAPQEDPAAQTAVSQTQVQEKNEAAHYDEFIIETFAGASDADLGTLNFAVSAFCIGVLDDRLAARLPIDPRWIDALTSVDETTCTEIEVFDFMIRTEPTGATAWDEAVRMRYERVVWWGDLADFNSHAIRVCNDLPSSLDLDPNFELSTSAQIELDGMMSEECKLLFDDPASDTGRLTGAGDADLNFWLFYTAFGAEVEGTRQPRDLWRVHAATGEQQKIVDVGADEHGGVQTQVEVSPDQSRILYAVKERIDDTGSDRLGLFIASLDGSNPVRIGDVAENSRFFWSHDGSEIVSNDGDYDADKFIVAFDTRDLSKRVITEQEGRDLWLSGVVDGSIYYHASDENDRYRFYRADGRTGEDLDVLDIGYVSWRVDPASGVAVFDDSSQADIGRVGIVDLQATSMQVVDVPTPHGYNQGPKISPDGQYITFSNGLEQFGGGTALVATLDAPEERLDVESVFPSGQGGVTHWTPDSRGLIITNGEPWNRDMPRQQPTMYFVSLELELVELGQGRPVAIVPG